MPNMEQPATARRVAPEISALVEKLESHAQQDATQGGPAATVAILTQKENPCK